MWSRESVPESPGTMRPRGQSGRASITMSLRTATRSSRSAAGLSAGRSAAHCAMRAASPAARGPQDPRWPTSSIHGNTSVQRGSWDAAGAVGAEALAIGAVRETSHATRLPRAVSAISGTGPLPARARHPPCAGGCAVCAARRDHTGGVPGYLPAAGIPENAAGDGEWARIHFRDELARGRHWYAARWLTSPCVTSAVGRTSPKDR